MARSLVIVESPAKARTINRYLGKDFIVKSSIGHIRDLPFGGKASDPKARAKEAAKTRKLSAKAKESYRKQRARDQLVRRMGVDPEHDWKATYEILPGKEKVVDELRRLAEKSDQIYLATDLDREGEAIAWHLKETIGGDPDRYRRVVFNEITRKAIQEVGDRWPQHDRGDTASADFKGRHDMGGAGAFELLLRLVVACTGNDPYLGIDTERSEDSIDIVLIRSENTDHPPGFSDAAALQVFFTCRIPGNTEHIPGALGKKKIGIFIHDNERNSRFLKLVGDLHAHFSITADDKVIVQFRY